MHGPHITGSTRLVGLLGWPVGHSVSPVFQNHLFAHYGLDTAYVPLGVPSSRLHSAIQAIRACGFVGANVTVPHKQQVIHYCDGISDLCAAVGAVNTMYLRDGRMLGTTTDADGFFRAIAAVDPSALAGSVVLLGNGGVARTLAFAIAMKGGCESLVLAGRSPQRVKALAAEVSRACGVTIEAVGIDSPRFGAVMKSCTLLINGTSAGMHPLTDVTPVPAAALHKGMFVFDTVYNPAVTRLMAEAEAAGCRVENGLAMLVYQGLASFALWTGIEPDETLIDLAGLRSLISAQQSRKDGA